MLLNLKHRSNRSLSSSKGINFPLCKEIFIDETTSQLLSMKLLVGMNHGSKTEENKEQEFDK
jgi:hypothetical protein